MAVLSQCVVAFDERRASPASNVGTLGSAGDVTWTGTKRLVADTTAFVYLPGVSGNGLTVADDATFHPSSSFQVDFDLTPDALTTGSTKTIVSQYSAAGGNRTHQMVADTTALTFLWSADGTATAASASVLYSTLGFTNGTPVRGRMIWRANNGSGNYDVRWYTVDSAGTATLVETDTGAGTSSFYNSTANVEVGGRSGLLTDFFPTAVHKVSLTVDGTLRLNIDTSVLTDESATSFTATTGQTVTINRSTGATYKTEVVVPGRPSRILNGTSDYGEVADNASLDFGASDSFTVWALIRTWATFGTNDSIVAKKANTTDTTAGWSIGNGPSTAAQVRAEIGDGTNGVGCTTSASRTSGALTMVSLVRSVAADTIAAGIDGTLATPVTDTTTGSLANSEVVRFGRLSGAGTEYTPMRVYAWGIYPGVMTATQLATLKTELTGADTSVGPRVATLSVPTREVALSVDSREVALSVPTRTLELTV